MRKYITELLDDMNATPALMEQYAKDPQYNAVLKGLFEYAFLPSKKWILPEGEPPYKQAPEPLGMTETNIYVEFRRLYVFCRADLKPIKRESMFIGLLEGVHPTEAAMLIAIKDQKLNKLYPKITKAAVIKAGFIENETTTSTKN